MTRADEALAIHEQRYGHSVSWVELADGRILMNGGRNFSVSADRGITWGPTYEGTDESGKKVRPYGLVNLADDAVGGVIHSSPGGELYFLRTTDLGKTWTDKVLINPRDRAHLLQDVLLRTSSGRIIVPANGSVGQDGDFNWHHEGAPFVGGFLNGVFVSTDAHFLDPSFGFAMVFYSDDEGQTWQKSDGELLIILEPGGTMEAVWEPSVTEVSSGKLLMLMRTRLGRYYQAWSYDDGHKWTRPQPTHLAGTHAPAQVRTLKNGHLLCVFTQQSEEEVRRGFIRTRLSSAVSRTGGTLWELFQNVQSIHEETHVEPGPIRRVRPASGYAVRESGAFENDIPKVAKLPVGYGIWSYPSVLVLDDRVLISHTYSYYDETGTLRNGGGSRLKVLPISWFYGGREPSESSILKKLTTPPQP